MATQFGIGDAGPGDSVSSVEAYLGTSYSSVVLEEPGCTVLFDEGSGLGVVTSGDGIVQTHIIWNPAVRTPEGIGVGSTYEELVGTYPDWVSEGVYDGYTTSQGGRFVALEISAPGTTPDNSSTGRHMLFELDAQERVFAYRVGAPPFVFHTEVCGTPG